MKRGRQAVERPGEPESGSSSVPILVLDTACLLAGLEVIRQYAERQCAYGNGSAEDSKP